MSRLPKPGGDPDVWGDILNDFLLVEHAPDGTHRVGVNPDASTSSKGKIRLAGDLGGTADAPTVPGLANKADVATVAAKVDKSVVTTKGDLLAATGAGAVARVGVGSNGEVLTADSTQTAGVRWTAAPPDLNAVHKGDLFLNVKDYGALGDGATDDTTAIRNALTALPEGHVLYFPAGVYMISGALTLKRNQTIQGVHAARWAYDSGSPSVIKALPSFSGPSLIYIPDMVIIGASQETDGGRILSIALDGSVVGSSVDGIRFEGQCRDWKIMDVSVTDVSGSGIRSIGYTRPVEGYMHCKGFSLHRVAVNKARNNGFSFNDTTDSIFFDCLAVGCFSNGFFITGAGENQYFCCRAVFNGAHGFVYGGNHTGGVFSSCTTDRNDKDGFRITATGAYPVVLYGLVARRDGRNNNNGWGGYAGVHVVGTAGNLASPVWINGLVQATGVDDNDTGVNSPQYGIRAEYCRFLFIDGMPWGDDQSFYDGGGNVIVRFSPNTYSTTGLPASPTRDTTTKEQDFEGSVSSATVVTSQVTSDTIKRFTMQAGGRMSWGPGTGAQDVNLYRNGAGLLQSDGRLRGVDGVTTKTNTGAVTDAAFTNTPTDGTLAVDTTNHVLYLRSAGTWTSVGSAASLLAPQSLTFRSGSETWTNQPAGLTEYLGGTTRRVKQDLTNMNQARLQVSLTTASSAGATLAVQYSTDNGGTWDYLDGVSGPSCVISATGLAVSGWVNLAVAAKADVLLRLVGAGGNGATSPVFVNVLVQFKP